MQLRSKNLLVDLTWGIGYGLGMAVLLSLWVALVTAGKAAQVTARYGLDPIEIMQTYLIAGASAGAIVGYFRPATRHPIGAFLVGTLAGSMVYGAMAFAMSGKIDGFNLAFAGIAGMIVGGSLGLKWSSDARAAEKDG